MKFDRYILRQLVSRITIIILITVMILLLENMLTLFNFMIQTGGPVFVVFQMLFFLIPEYLALGLSIGLMLGIMLVFRKMATEQELVSAMACRHSPMRLMRMPILVGLVFALLNFSILGYLRPYSEYQYSKLSFDARHGAFGVSLKAGKFTEIGTGTTLYADSVGDDGNTLSAIFLEMQDDKGSFTYATAETGSFFGSSDPNVMIFKLRNGRLVTSTQSKDGAKPQTLVFDVFDLPITLPEIPGFRDPSTLKELALPALLERSYNMENSAEERRKMSGEAHKRIVLSILPLILPFLAVALAVPPPRKTSPVGIVVGLGLLIAMFKVLDFAVLAPDANPVVIIWSCLGLFILMTLRFFYQYAYKVGQPPLSGLSTVTDAVIGAIVKYLKRKQPA